MATTTASKSTTTSKTSSQPATGLGSLAMTNSLLASGQALLNKGSSSSSTSNGRDELPAGIAYQTYNPDGSVRESLTSAQLHTKNATDITSGKDTPIGVGGELTGQSVTSPVPSTPITPPATPTNTPVDTNQPSPSTVNATPYTSTSQPAGDTSSSAGLTASQQAHAAALASGAPAPQNAGIGMSAATTAMANTNQSYTPTAPVVQAYTDATQKLTDDYAKAMSSQDQGKSLVEQYQDFTSQLGIPQLNTQLMNMKNIIDGTEDDIRNEVTKAGGFATDSQVLAMTNARNKTMIQNYNNLLQTRSDAMQQVQTLVGLSAQDRQYAQQQIDRQLNFDQQQVTFADKALTNAQQSIQQSIATYGAASVLKQAQATGDPTAVARINATMGNGFNLQTAALNPTLDEQAKMAQIAASRASTANAYSNIAKNQYDMQATQNAQAGATVAAANTADTVLGSVTKAMKQVNGLSSGLLGGSTAFIPGSPSKNLQSTISTIKSNLAFTELAKMRASSPTGGALGQISDKEEELLSSTVANLDVGQSPAQLKQNLQAVQTHYVNYLQSLGYGYDAATGTVISP